MKIKSVELRRADIEMVRKVGTSLGGSGLCSGVVVTLRTDDNTFGIGWAHENAFIAGETVATIESVINEVMFPVLEGRDPHELPLIMEEIGKRLVFNYRAKAAIDMALHDIVSKAADVPLWGYLGGMLRDRIECIRMIGLKSPDEMAEEAHELRQQGFRHYKLKVDASPLDDDRIRAVSDAVGKECGIVLDANQAYTPKGIIQLVDRLHDLNIVVLEQPVAVGDIDGLALVRRSVKPLVEADESIYSLDDACRILEKGAADIVSLKVPKMGGLHFTRKIADLCQSAGIPNLIGGNIGPCVIDLVHVHLGCSHPNVTSFACEIGESLRLSRDIAYGLDIRDGTAFAGDKPGIGVEISPTFSN